VVRLPRVAAARCLAAAIGVGILGGASLTAGAAAPDPATLYHEAMATTKAWTVHYTSESVSGHVPFFESGDAGPASGTQTIRDGTGAKLDSASLIVIGDLTYLKGNALAMQALAGLSPSQATAAAGHWVQFSSTNPLFSQVVVGVRSHDVAQEIALSGPYSFGPTRTLHGLRVEAIRGTQALSGTKRVDVVLYVRASGRPMVVEEDTVSARGTPDGAEHIVFSKWGESVRPKAPNPSITLGRINTT
jgi:hypothetical protein